jgi:hypothetical protein
VSLARIYDDLGFEQVGLLEATKSLSLSPANYSAHRFLSDVYLGQPRLEIARVSELLQAQLLQPININPIQPSLSLADLNVVAGAGPANPAFNELTPLFQRNQAQLTTTGLVGNNETFGEEVIASGLYNRYSVSAGQLYSSTDGFRADNDVRNTLYDVFGQAAVTPNLSLQAEYRRRETRQGDLALRFDPDFILPFFRVNTDQDVARIGAHWNPLVGVDAIASAFYTNRDERAPAFDEKVEDEGYQAELQFILGQDQFDTIVGGGFYDIDVDHIFFDGSKQHFKRQQDNAYFYTTLSLPAQVNVTLGVSYDRFDEDPVNLEKANPKLGAQWDITDQVRFRAAVFQTVKRALAAQQTIEPTQIAGFNQFFDDFNGTKALNYGLAFDVDLENGIFLGVEAVKRDLEMPVLTQFGFENEKRNEEVLRAYAYWAPHPRWAFSLEYVYDRFSSDQSIDPDFPKSVRSMSVPAAVRYFDPLGYFAELGGTFVNQSVSRQSDILDGRHNFFLLDAVIGYRLPWRAGLIGVEGSNLLDEDFKFQDDSFRTSETRNSRFIPARSFLARLTLNF